MYVSMLLAFGLLLGCVRLPGQQTGELRSETGRVVLGGGEAVLDVPPGLVFYPRVSARHIVEVLWRNPVGPELQGLVLPARTSPLDTTWAIVIGLVCDGHVETGDGRLDDAALLAALRRGTAQENRVRLAMGSPPIRSLEWDRQPSYEPARRRLSWRTRLQFELEGNETVNAHDRLLGRVSHLEFSTLAHTRFTRETAQRTAQVVSAARFLPGHRYEDYRAGDRRSGYGLDRLVLGEQAEATAPVPAVTGRPRAAGADPIPWAAVVAVLLAGVAFHFVRQSRARALSRSAP